MEDSFYSLQTLFRQLGMEDDWESINAFIGSHRHLSNGIFLHEADFWNQAQATFLAEAIEQDSDWCVLVDRLDTLLRNGADLTA